MKYTVHFMVKGVNKKFVFFSLLIFSFVVLSSGVLGETLLISDVVGDSWIQSDSPNDTNENSNYLAVKYSPFPLLEGSDQVEDIRKSFIKFNLGSELEGVEVHSASLRLFLSASPNNNRTHYLKRVLGNWSEENLSWNSQPALNVNLSDQKEIFPEMENTWVEYDVTSDVLGFLGGDFENQGWAVEDSGESESTKISRYRSINYDNETLRPQLVVNYSLPVEKDVVDATDLSKLLNEFGPCGLNCSFDLNNDTKIDEFDVTILLALWGKTIDEKYLANNPDINGDGSVDGTDLAYVLGSFGPCELNCSSDIYLDGIVDSTDLGIVKGFWREFNAEILSPFGALNDSNLTINLNLTNNEGVDCFYNITKGGELFVNRTEIVGCSSGNLEINESGDYIFNLFIEKEGIIIFQSSSNFSLQLPVATISAPIQEIAEERRHGGGGCTSEWVCDSWSACADGLQTRTCEKEIEVCYANIKNKPIESRSCEEELLTEESLSTENTNPFSFITGAVTGVIGNTPRPMVAFLIILALFGASIGLTILKKKGYLEGKKSKSS